MVSKLEKKNYLNPPGEFSMYFLKMEKDRKSVV